MSDDVFTRMALEAAAESLRNRPLTIRPLQVRFADGSIAGEVTGVSYQELPDIRPVDTPPEDPYSWDVEDIKFRFRVEEAFAFAPVPAGAVFTFSTTWDYVDPDAWYLFGGRRSHAERAEEWIADFRAWPSWRAFRGAVKHAFLSGIEDA